MIDKKLYKIFYVPVYHNLYRITWNDVVLEIKFAAFQLRVCLYISKKKKIKL